MFPHQLHLTFWILYPDVVKNYLIIVFNIRKLHSGNDIYIFTAATKLGLATYACIFIVLTAYLFYCIVHDYLLYLYDRYAYM